MGNKLRPYLVGSQSFGMQLVGDLDCFTPKIEGNTIP